jgi:hypothetical protein
MSNVTPINSELGEVFAQLPASCSTRWNARRKAAVVRAVQSGVISLEKAQAMYRLSLSEFYSWQRFLHVDGVDEVFARPLGVHSAGEVEGPAASRRKVPASIEQARELA